MKILLIEDDPVDMKLLTIVLDSGGHEVLGKVSAEEALEAIKLSHPEAILLDLKLPGMDGLTLAGLLKADPATRGIPVIAITALREKFSRSEVMGAGCDAFFFKPIDTRRISDEVTSVASKAGRPLPPK